MWIICWRQWNDGFASSCKWNSWNLFLINKHAQCLLTCNQRLQFPRVQTPPIEQLRNGSRPNVWRCSPQMSLCKFQLGSVQWKGWIERPEYVKHAAQRIDVSVKCDRKCMILNTIAIIPRVTIPKLFERQRITFDCAQSALFYMNKSQCAADLRYHSYSVCFAISSMTAFPCYGCYTKILLEPGTSHHSRLKRLRHYWRKVTKRPDVVKSLSLILRQDLVWENQPVVTKFVGKSNKIKQLRYNILEQQ
jgi:hypothetical protein